MDLVSSFLLRVLSTRNGILLGVMILVSLQNNYLLSPPTIPESKKESLDYSIETWGTTLCCNSATPVLDLVAPSF